METVTEQPKASQDVRANSPYIRQPSPRPGRFVVCGRDVRIEALEEALDDAREIALWFRTEEPSNDRCLVASAQLRLVLERLSRGVPAGGDALMNLVMMCAGFVRQRRLAP